MAVALLSLNTGRNWPMQFIPSDVFLNIRTFLIFLLMRHPHNDISSKLLYCSTSRTNFTDGHHMSVQIIIFVVMSYRSPITLHYNAFDVEYIYGFVMPGVCMASR